jgi:hypothetical protein
LDWIGVNWSGLDWIGLEKIKKIPKKRKHPKSMKTDGGGVSIQRPNPRKSLISMIVSDNSCLFGTVIAQKETKQTKMNTTFVSFCNKS